MRELCLKKISIWATDTSGPRPIGVKMNYRYFRSEIRTSGGWWRKTQFGVKMNYQYYR
jgi:hypothetical protein